MNQLRGKRRKRSGDVCGGCRSKCEWAATMLRGQGVREDVLLPALKVGAAVNISAALHRDLSEAELSVLSMRASAMMALTRSFFFFLVDARQRHDGAHPVLLFSFLFLIWCDPTPHSLPG